MFTTLSFVVGGPPNNGSVDFFSGFYSTQQVIFLSIPIIMILILYNLVGFFLTVISYVWNLIFIIGNLNGYLASVEDLEIGQMQKMRVHKKLILCDDFAVMMMGKGRSIQYLGHAVDNHALYTRPSAASVGIFHLYLTYKISLLTIVL